jgi:hypothetical protein
MGTRAASTVDADGTATAGSGGKGPGKAAGQFGRGRDPLERLKVVEVAEEAAPLPAGLPGRLAAMQKVFGQMKSLDRGGERRLREFLEKDPRGYWREMLALEERLAEKESGGRAGPDEGRERAEAACERLLEAWKKGERS